jgi:anaerobic selenocysteine-containing dehydrogenase
MSVVDVPVPVPVPSGHAGPVPEADAVRTAYRTCPLCEAACGLELRIHGERVVGARGDSEHVFSHGFLCPKGASFGALVHDPDRLHRPLVRDRGDTNDGAHREVGWEEAFASVEAGLRRVLDTHGQHAVAVYVGNPNVHTMAGALYLPSMLKALGTRNVFSASTVDQMPKQVACAHMFGHPGLIPVPDLDRTDYLLMLGANPAESNGSLCTAPDFVGRMRAVQARGGRVVVVDPRRTRSAGHADEHLFIRPGTDAYLLFGIVHTLFDEKLVRLGHLAGHTAGVDGVGVLARELPPERVADVCRIPADTIRRLARELAGAPSAAVYGRLGTSTVPFGTVASWLVDAVNVLTGNLDRPGGAMFPLAAHARADTGPGGHGYAFGRWTSRVRGLGEVLGELPSATLTDEIVTPGDGQVRALVTVAGNPVLSTPNGARLDGALAGLDFMVSVDPYLNESTRHADVVLPPADPARAGHYDFFFGGLAVRQHAAYSPPVLPPDPGGMGEEDILARLIGIATGGGAAADPGKVHAFLLDDSLRRAVSNPASPVAGRDVAELAARVTGSTAAERLLDVALRTGAYGDGFGADPDGLSLATLLANPHGVDLGPLRPRIPALLRTPSGKIELCPEPIAADVRRLLDMLGSYRDGLVLVGRRHLRSNNSWMHNVPAMVKGRDRCTLLLHPDDATRTGVADGALARVVSRVGSVDVPVEVTAEIMPGVVSLPHGWGHGVPGTRMGVANAHPGVNANVLTDELAVDPLSGNAVLSGVPVTVSPANVSPTT